MSKLFPANHGDDHGPFAPDPARDTRWYYWADSDNGLSFQNGWVDSGGTFTRSRYRMRVGMTPLIELNVTDGTPNTVIAALPTGWWDGSNQPVAACDDAGTFHPYSILANGNIKDGMP